jgi:hypothetical protein
MIAAGAQGLAVIHDKDSIPLIIEACKRVPVEVARSLAGSLKYFDDDPRALAAADMYLPKPPDPIEALKKDEESIGYEVEQVVMTHRVEAMPLLKEKFSRTQNVDDKMHIASALVRLGDMEFQQSVAIDPTNAEAWEELADSYAHLGADLGFNPGEVGPKARAALAKTLELDPDLASAHATSGWLRL